MLVDSNFDIKIADFGFAASMNQTLDNGKSHILTDNLGTRGYKAPEIKKSTILL